MPDVYDYIIETGVIQTPTDVINAQVIIEFQNAFGTDLIVTPNTPQGLLIIGETLARIAVANNNAVLANQINPNLSGGIFLDALLALTGSFRTPATHSLVLCTITGVTGTSIPSGSQISDSNSNLFETIETIVIPIGGIIYNVPFQSVLTGEIIGLANTLNVIVSNILGWETVNNPNDAILGASTQSDASTRLFRQNTLASQGTGLAESIISALYLISINSLTFQENVESIPQTINRILMVPHSLYTCVAPGTATLLQIATTLTNTKSGGCSYNNGLGIPQNITVRNQFSGQLIPVLFDTPSIVTISIIVTVHNFTTVQDITTAVQNAIISYTQGNIPNQPGFTVGQDVSPFQIASAINHYVTGIFVQEVEVSKQSFTQIATLSNGFNTVTNLTYNSDIAPAMGVTGANITGGTAVTSLVGDNGLILSNPTVIPPLVLSGIIQNGFNTITGLESNAQIVVGMNITGANIPGGTTVLSLTGTTGLIMSSNATASTTENLTFIYPSAYPVTEILTFTQPTSYQTTEIPIQVWQQAITFTGLITVTIV